MFHELPLIGGHGIRYSGGMPSLLLRMVCPWSSDSRREFAIPLVKAIKPQNGPPYDPSASSTGASRIAIPLKTGRQSRLNKFGSNGSVELEIGQHF